MFGAYTTARGMAISRLVIRFFWFGFSSVAVTYIYLKVLHERNGNSNDHSIFGYTVYAALRLVVALLLKFPACRLRASHLVIYYTVLRARTETQMSILSINLAVLKGDCTFDKDFDLAEAMKENITLYNSLEEEAIVD